MSDKTSLLATGYVRRFSFARLSHVIIPNEIICIIALYSRYFNVYAIGDNTAGELGIDGSEESSKTELECSFMELINFEEIVTSVDQVYYGYYRYLILRNRRQLFTAGRNFKSALGVGIEDENYASKMQSRQFIRIFLKYENQCLFKNLISSPNTSNGNEDKDISTEYNVALAKNMALMDEDLGLPTIEPEILLVSNGVCAEHTFVLTVNGDFYGFGCAVGNAFGEYDHLNYASAKYLSNVTLVFRDTFAVQIKQIKCGDQYSIFLSANGRVFGCGLNGHGQLAHDTNTLPVETVIELTQILEVAKNVSIIDVIVGGWHTMFITKQNKLYVCGRNDCGQLGIDTGKGYNHLFLHPFFANMSVIKCSAGNKHSMVITDDYNCYTFGNNNWSQVTGNHKTITFGIVEVPHLIMDDNEIYAIAIEDGECGCWHSLFLLHGRQNVIFFHESRYLNGLNAQFSLQYSVGKILCGFKNVVLVSV